MTFTFHAYQPQSMEEYPLNNAIAKMLAAYKGASEAKYLQPNMQAELEKSKLYNQYYGPEKESEMGLRTAQTGHANAQTEGLNIENNYMPEKLRLANQKAEFSAENPFFGETGTSADLGRLMHMQYLRNHPELAAKYHLGGMGQAPGGYTPGQGQPPYAQGQVPIQNDRNGPDMDELIRQAMGKVVQAPGSKQYAPSNIAKLQKERSLIKSGTDPNTGQKFTSKEEQEDALRPYNEKLGGLKNGEHFLYDEASENNKPIGIERPFTPKERETEAGRAFFNTVFPSINNGFSGFVGKGSVKNFINYADNYGKDPIATKKIDDLLLAQKLISAGVVNEAATLGSGKTNMTYKNITSSFPGSDLPKMIERYGKELKLPSDAFVKAGIRFQDVINKASQFSYANIPEMKKVYYHPEKYVKNEEEKNAHLAEHEETITVRNKKTGDKETISKAEARKRGIDV